MYNLPDDAVYVLWSVRRALAKAKSFSISDAADRRLALILTSEVRGHIESLTGRLRVVENEMKAVNRSIVAVSAYSRCANTSWRATWVKAKGAKS
jgi:hypothetical protein